MDLNLEEPSTMEAMDFDHSGDVVNQEDIPLEDSSRLDNISMDMDVGEQSHNLMEAVNDEVIVSDLIEDPFPFQEYTIPSNAGSGSNIIIDPNQLNQLTVQNDSAASIQAYKVSGPTTSNVVTLKVAQQRPAKRLIANAPPRQVAIAPKPVQAKSVQYAIAPKPVALIANKAAIGVKKVPAQIGRQIVMVPKKIKFMSSASFDGAGNPSPVQYQVACTPDQAQLMGGANKGTKPLVKLIQVQGQSSTEQTPNSGVITKLVPANVPRARYVMQQKTVPISIGGNKLVQNVKIAGKKQIIAIKSQSPKVMQAVQGNVATKKVLISSNPSQKVLIRTNAPTTTTQLVKDSGSIGQRTQFHPINVPGKGIQYIKLVTNQPTQKTATKPVAVPSKNFVFTDSKGNVIQMTAEKVAGQTPSIVVPGSVTAANKALVKTVKTQKKLVRIAPVSKAVATSLSLTVRPSQSLLAPIASITTTPAATTQMTSLPSISPVTSTVETVTIEQFNDMVENNEKCDKVQQYSLNNYVDKSQFIDGSELSGNEFAEEYSANEYSTADDSHLQDDTVEEEKIDVKPTLQSLITDALGNDGTTEEEQMHNYHEVEVEYANKRESIRNASFILEGDNMEHNTNTGEMNEESIIIVPGNNFDNKNESMYSDESQFYRNQRLSVDDRKEVPLLSVETECIPYTDHMLSSSPPPMSDPEAVANLEMRPRKACNCTKSQCLKLYCDCFANGEFCNNCNCNKCHNNLENEEIRQKAIRSCLERNPNAFRPKIGKSNTGGPEIIRRHTKGCNCKRSGCLKNYCECYEAKIACTTMCKCVGCRNVEETVVRRHDANRLRDKLKGFRPAPSVGPAKQPCSFMTTEVIEAVCQCLIAAAGESDMQREETDPVQDVIEEFARCLQDVITASHQTL